MWVSLSNGHVGLNPVGGHISADMITYALNSSDYNIGETRPRLDVVTYGFVGGGALVEKDYDFVGNFHTSNSYLAVNSDLSGVIAYYTVSAYGDRILIVNIGQPKLN